MWKRNGHTYRKLWSERASVFVRLFCFHIEFYPKKFQTKLIDPLYFRPIPMALRTFTSLFSIQHIACYAVIRGMNMNKRNKNERETTTTTTNEKRNHTMDIIFGYKIMCAIVDLCSFFQIVYTPNGATHTRLPSKYIAVHIYFTFESSLCVNRRQPKWKYAHIYTWAAQTPANVRQTNGNMCSGKRTRRWIRNAPSGSAKSLNGFVAFVLDTFALLLWVEHTADDGEHAIYAVGCRL